MKILLITENLKPTSGWGRYSLDIVSALEFNGVEASVYQIPHPLRFKKHFFLGWYEALRIAIYHRGKEFDVIHSAIEPYSCIAYWLSKFTGKKYFITVHGTYGIAPYKFRLFERYFHKKSF
ncbi:MAG: hypothetical protein WD000_03070, partial [Thermodesulfobacteriota bacterium]